MSMKVREVEVDPPLAEMPALKVADHREFRVKKEPMKLAPAKRRRSFLPPESTPVLRSEELGIIRLPPVPYLFIIPAESTPLLPEHILSGESAEVVDINTAVKKEETPLQVDEDDSIAYTAWLEAYTHFGHDRSLHRIEKQVVERLDGSIYIKRIHVGKVYVCELLPGDHFGDPDGRRHQAAGGYPTRSLYEQRAGESQYMRAKKADNSRPRLGVVTGEKQHYDGPHWTSKMSKQTGVAGFYGCGRPPTFAEVLSQHWGDIARFHQVVEETTQKDYLLKSGEIQSVVRVWKIRSAKCWGHTPLGIQTPIRKGTISPPSSDALELLSSQQSDLEAANDPRTLDQYGSVITDLELNREIGTEYVRDVNTGARQQVPMWLDDGQLFLPPPVKEIVIPTLNEVVLLLPLLKPVVKSGFNLQYELSQKLLREAAERHRVERMLEEHEEIQAPTRWRQVSNTLFETLRASRDSTYPNYRNLGCQGFSNIYPDWSENFYDKWWEEVAAETEEARLAHWFLTNRERSEVSRKEAFVFVRDGNHVSVYSLVGPRKAKQKIKINYVDRIERKQECEVVDLSTVPQRWAEEAVDLTRALFQKPVVKELNIDENDYGIDAMTGLYLPKHLNSSPKDFKAMILPPERKKQHGLLGRIRGALNYIQ